ncbi:MAG TPA: hypothetical protein DCM44_08110, partial [Pantoea sp.]|nr:hypothetical protein [Pantoea sp.]
MLPAILLRLIAHSAVQILQPHLHGELRAARAALKPSLLRLLLILFRVLFLFFMGHMMAYGA